MKRLLLLPLLAFAGCAPQALYFHETAKVAFTATYNTADSQPLSSNFGYKRRIVAVVPAQVRVLGDRGERNGTNRGEALSIVSKFRVRIGTFGEGVTIVNRFASGVAARKMTHSENSSASLNALLHGDPVAVETPKLPDGTVLPPESSTGAAVNARINRIMGKFVAEDTSGPTKKKAGFDADGKPEIQDKKKAEEGKANEDKPAKTKVIIDPVTGKPKIVPIGTPDPKPADPSLPLDEGTANELKSAKKKVIKDPVTGEFKVVPIDQP